MPDTEPATTDFAQGDNVIALFLLRGGGEAEEEDNWVILVVFRLLAEKLPFPCVTVKLGTERDWAYFEVVATVAFFFEKKSR